MLYKSVQVQKSQLSGETVQIRSGQDVTLTASDVVAKGNVAVEAAGHITVNTLNEHQEAQAYSQTKKSGFSLAGIGISYGTEKLKTTQREAQSTPIGSTIASLDGQTTLTAGQNVQATSAQIVGKTGVAIQGQNVTLDGTYATYEAHNTVDYKKSGLTISLGGVVPQAVSAAASNIRQGNRRDDKRLTTLEYGEAARELQQGLTSVKAYSAYTPDALRMQADTLKTDGEQLIRDGENKQRSLSYFERKDGEKLVNDGTAAVEEANSMRAVADNPTKFKQEKDRKRDALIHLQIGIGSQSASQRQDIRQSVYQAGTVASEAGRIVITATGKAPDSGHITAVGEDIRGQAVSLIADNTVRLASATNTTHIDENNRNQGWSAGVSVGLTGFLGANVSANQGKAVALTDATTHTGTTVTGTDAVSVQSGRDVVLTGSTLTGNRVDVTAGGDLQIRSVQDTETYKEDRKQAGFSLAFDTKGISDFTPEAKKGITRSTYEAVTKQAGIYAGTDGVGVIVQGNTDLTGAVIASQATPDKNAVTTGTLTMQDITNKAEFSNRTMGVGYTFNRAYEEVKGKAENIQKAIAERDKRLGIHSGDSVSNYLTAEERQLLNTTYNKIGLVPDLSTGSKGQATSVTKSAITEGTLTVTKKPIDTKQINRNTANTLNVLGKIFDKVRLIQWALGCPLNLVVLSCG